MSPAVGFIQLAIRQCQPEQLHGVEMVLVPNHFQMYICGLVTRPVMHGSPISACLRTTSGRRTLSPKANAAAAMQFANTHERSHGSLGTGANSSVRNSLEERQIAKPRFEPFDSRKVISPVLTK